MLLFRNEVIQAKKNHLTGNVILFQPQYIRILSILTFVLFILFILFLYQSEYARKETVKGYLIPDRGLVKVYSDRAGVVNKLLVTEGMHVQQDEPIAQIRNSQSLSTGIELSIVLSKELKTQINTLKRELEVTLSMYDQK